MKTMQKLAVIVLGVVLFSATFAGMASAQPNPSVSNLTPFSAETNYMSLSGYLRYVNHQHTGQWLTVPEAGRIVQQQKGG
jgi:hypothetical protein